ncbi:MAG: bifunctional demethylmenaquinone methyltransferase/2-methoxy-6-polyprenyl-1,4-benzoquinol methylase UbiE [Candidatus Hydrogenedentes bacterium]|nr:bifunctional demethylmenaquinone methyltransferase/2-methoxy-6-polyprenyl-1,4-benzoquinol methylase UbiE [Candidatus Hydrogenedentota bacterium]
MPNALTHPPASTPARTDVWRMFDRIAHRYDLLNRVLSMRQDVAWRRRLAQMLPARDDLRVLDLATGTGDVLLALRAGCPRVRSGVGMDMAGKMLELGKDKFEDRGQAPALQMVRGDATCIPAADGSFDAATIAFGIRNVLDVGAALREMHRVLRPGGRVLILEFSLPPNALVRRAYLLYFRNVLPRIGGIVSGDSHAYRYLNQTVETFPYGDAFCDLMRGAGFSGVTQVPLTFGIATIYQGDK